LQRAVTPRPEHRAAGPERAGLQTATAGRRSSSRRSPSTWSGGFNRPQAVHAAGWMSLKPAVDRRGGEQLARGAGRELAEGEPPSA